jgi:Holliday junction resolvasome RuvABC endonuclease subunit
MIVVGLDLSLTATGLVVLAENAGIAVETTLTSDPAKSTSERISQLWRGIVSMWPLTSPFDMSHVALWVIEGYAFGVRNGLALSGEVGGVIKYHLWQQGQKMLIVPPDKLKKFTAGPGQGNCKKEIMLKEVYRQWKYDTSDNNRADAYALARIGLGYLGWDIELHAYQREIIEELRTGKRPTKKSRKKVAS